MNFWRKHSIASGGAVALVFLVLALAVEYYGRVQTQNRLASASSITSAQIASRLESITTTLEQTASRWNARGGTEEVFWRLDAEMHRQRFPEIIAVEWADSDYRVRWIEPLAGNEAALELDLTFEPNRARALTAAVESNTPYITPLVELVQGGTGFLAFYPVRDVDGGPGGLLLNVVDLGALVQHGMAGFPVDTYAVEIRQNGQTVASLGERAGVDRFADRDLSFDGHAWSLRIHAGPGLSSGVPAVLPVLLLLLGALGGAATHCLLRDAREQDLHARALSAARDLEHREVEAANAFRNLIVAAVPDYIFVKDENFVIVDANEKFLSLYPEDMRDGVIGTTTVEQYVPEERELFLKEDRRAFETGQSEVEETIQMPSGDTLILSTRKIRFHDSQGRAFILGVARDITEQKRTERHEREARERAERSERVKGEFLANMSHEIRTPMNGILGLSRILEKEKLPGESAKHARLITQSAESLLSILNDILDLSKVESDEFELEHHPFRIGKLAGRIKSLHTPAADEKALSLDVVNTVDRHRQHRVGDSTRIAQIINNLVSNAIKFTERGGVTITISDAPSDDGAPDRIRIEVADTGIGMDPEQVLKVFDKFVQADTSTTRLYGGTGLGLAIVKRLAESMGGAIEVHSASGEGTVFCVSLPLEVADASLAQEREADEDLVVLDPLRVLAVDDNLTNRIVLEAHLKGMNVDVVLANNGAEAVDAVETERFDLVLMDIHMPIMNGEEALERIRESEAERGVRPTPVVALSADAMKHQIAARLALGFDGYLVKPVEPKDLLELITDITQRGETSEGAARTA